MYNVIMYLIAFLKVHTLNTPELKRCTNTIIKNLIVLSEEKWWELDLAFAGFGEIKNTSTFKQKLDVIITVISEHLSSISVTNTNDITWLCCTLIANTSSILEGGLNITKEV
jgi:hypothetical protein